MASKDMNDIAMIDHAEFSKLGTSHSLMSGRPAYLFSLDPEALDMKTACIFIPAELPAIETKLPSALSYIIAALKPAFCAIRTLSSKLHPPLLINTKGKLPLMTSLSSLLNAEHASIGSAKYKTPHSPEPFIAGAKLASVSSKERVTLFPINTTFENATEQTLNRIVNDRTTESILPIPVNSLAENKIKIPKIKAKNIYLKYIESRIRFADKKRKL